MQIQLEKCFYCGACVSVCPENALELIDSSIKINDNCRNCGICTNTCPAGAIEVEK